MKMKNVLELSASVAIALLTGVAQSADIVRANIPSGSMKRDIPVRIVLPVGYADATNRYPVVYLLHGAGGSCETFLAKEYWPVLSESADCFGCLFVLPDGSPDSWWFDSPIDSSFCYETHVTKEVVPFVDANYRTIPDRAHRAIAGGSMGGHGAGWIGIRHKDAYGAVGIIFGGVDFRKFPNNWHIRDRLGNYAENKDRWFKHTVLHEAASLKSGELDLISVVGTGDFFLDCNRSLHQLLSDNKVEHVHIEIRGGDEPHSTHHRMFCVMALKIVLPYFNRFFVEGKGRL